MHAQKIYRSPLPTGFMRGGFFAWPDREYKCVDCGTDCASSSATAERCAACQKAHAREWWRRYRAKQRRKR